MLIKKKFSIFWITATITFLGNPTLSIYVDIKNSKFDQITDPTILVIII